MHNSYIIPGVVDGQVIKEQAERRASDKRYPEETTIHYHHHGEHCVPECYIVAIVKEENSAASGT